MPRVFHQQYTVAIPPDAKPVMIAGRGGRQIPGVRFRGSDGKMVTAPLTRDGQRCRLASEYWYGDVPDPSVRSGRQRVKLATDRSAAEIMLGDLIRQASRAAAGMVDPAFEQNRLRPLAEHLESWAAELRTRPRGKRKRPPSPKHVQRVINRVRRVMDGCEFVLVGDIALTPVQEFLQALSSGQQGAAPELTADTFTRNELAGLLAVSPGGVRSLIKRHRLEASGNGKARRYPRSTAIALLDLTRRGLGHSTAGYYAREVKAFTRWLVKRKRLPEDPLADLPGAASDDVDHRRDRRALNAGELQALLAAAGQSTVVFRGMPGADRRHLYLAAMSTGFRAGELATLNPEHFELGGELPTVHLSAEAAKNGKAAVQPIAPDVAEAFRVYLAGRASDQSVWPGTWHERAADMLRLDLEAAGIPYVVEGAEGPLYADFHALRHSYVAMLDKSGATLKEAMHLARHQDPKLTMKRYGKPRLHDLAAAMGRVPRLLPDAPEELAATGTDSRAYTALTQNPEDRRGPMTSGDERQAPASVGPICHKSLKIKADDDRCRPVRSGKETGPSRIRTCNQGIMSPLLCR